jgi:acyl-CoA thioester hydrolase
MPKPQRDKDAIPPTHRTELRIPLFEVDLGHAVYHGNYFHLFELAREAFLRDLGYPYRRFMEQQMHLTVVEVSCSYRKSLRYDDLAEILTGIAWWRSRSLAFTQSIFRAAPPGALVLCTEATFNMVCIEFSGRPTVLPPDFVKLLEEWSGPHSSPGAP